MKTQFTVYRCTELRKVVQLNVGKFLIYVQFIKIRAKKVKNPTIVPLLSCMSNIFERITYMSLYEYCVSHELLISENSGFKRNDCTSYLL